MWHLQNRASVGTNLALRTLIAPIAIALVTLGLAIFQNGWPHWFNVPLAVLAYLAAINLVTQLAGFTIGAIAAGIAFLSFNFFFIEPYGTLYVRNEADILVLFLFVAIALINSRVLGRAQRNLLEAEMREREATRFYELSLLLISLYDVKEIARALSQRLRAILNAQAIAVIIDKAEGYAAVRVQEPENRKDNDAPNHIEPIALAHGALGEVHIWRKEYLTLSEKRLLRTFASETAMILERMRMSQAESRTKLLEESDRLKGALLSSVSHELRTPLATIRAGAESLQSGLVAPNSPAGRELMSDVNDAATYLTKLVNNMLDMTKIESGALHPQREWSELDEIVGNTVRHLRSELGNHSLNIDVPEALPLIAVDPIQMDQVLTNLITNSVKYAPAGTSIHLTATVQGDMMRACISNESSPLAREDLTRIFDKFYRVTNPSQVLGTGLGLSICKGIIEAHGGKIWAENRTGVEQGVSFIFTLPLVWNGALPKSPPSEN